MSENDAVLWGFEHLGLQPWAWGTIYGGCGLAQRFETGIGKAYRVIGEELNGATTVWDDPIEGSHKNGRVHLIPCLEWGKPLDLATLIQEV